MAIFSTKQKGATQALFAGVPFQGRALPLAVTPSISVQEKTAQPDQLEEVFLADIETPATRVRPVFMGSGLCSRSAAPAVESKVVCTLFVDARHARRKYQGHAVNWRSAGGGSRAIRSPSALSSESAPR